MTFLVGIVFTIALFAYMLFGSGDVQLLQLESIGLVLGGLIAASLMSFSVPTWKGLFESLGICIKNLAQEKKKRLKFILELGTVFFRGGAKKVEDQLDTNKAPDPLLDFVQQGLCSNFTFDDFNIMMRESISNKNERINESVKCLKIMASYSPGFGMLGTIYGLIKMLHGMSGDGGMEYLGQGMATALLTTFYGVILSQLIFLPLASLLEEKGATEINMLDKLRQVSLWVHRKTHPEDLKERMSALLDGK